MSHIHAVKDSDTNFKINPITRQVKNESSRKTTLIQYDHNSERFTFEIPRYVEFHDMALCNKAEIHYINIDQKTKQENRGTYPADDLRVKEDDSAAVVCSWLISNNATQFVGRLSFVVRYSCVENGKLLYAWNSAIASVDVSSGIDSGDYVVSEYADILERWRAELFNAGYINAATMQTEIKVLSARMDNFAKLPDGSTAGDAELMDLRIGANGKVYKSAGTAMRAQMLEKLGKKELAHIDYEIGNVLINLNGWDYTDQYYQDCRVRIKEGSEVHLVAGDIIGLTDYTNARFYCGIRDLDGVYHYSGWRTTDFVCEFEGDYIVLVSNTVDTEQTSAAALGDLIFMERVDGAGKKAENTNDLISSAVDIDLGFVLGSANANGFINHAARYVTKNILMLDIDIMLKRNPDKYRMAVHTYSDENGTGFVDLGWVTDKADHIIKAGTYFRVLAMQKDYETESATVIDPVNQYDHELYKSLEIFPVVGKKINLLKTARTISRITASNAQREAASALVTPPRMRSVNHRGWNHGAPENTLPAYILSKKNGFDFAECDVRWTSDHMPVLLHDVTINRTARNADGSEIAEAINIADITYNKALTYDFCGSNRAYAGTKIPTFEEFISLCRDIQIHPYIEIEDTIFEWQAIILMDIVRKYGMENHVTWISFTHNSLKRIVEQNPRGRVGYLRLETHTDVEEELRGVRMLKTDYNEAFLNLAYNNEKFDDYVSKAFDSGIPVEVWCPNKEDEILALPPYISGVTTDRLIAHEVFYEHRMGLYSV